MDALLLPEEIDYIYAVFNEQDPCEQPQEQTQTLEQSTSESLQYEHQDNYMPLAL